MSKKMERLVMPTPFDHDVAPKTTVVPRPRITQGARRTTLPDLERSDPTTPRCTSCGLRGAKETDSQGKPYHANCLRVKGERTGLSKRLFGG